MDKNLQTIASRRKHKHQLDQSKRNYARELAAVDQRTLEALKTLKEDYSQEQEDIILKANRLLRSEKEKLRDNLSEKFARKEEHFNKKIDAHKKDKEGIIHFYEREVERIKRMAQKDLKILTRWAEEQKVEDQRRFTKGLEERERQFNKSMNTMKQNFDKSMSITKNASRPKLIDWSRDTKKC